MRTRLPLSLCAAALALASCQSEEPATNDGYADYLRPESAPAADAEPAPEGAEVAEAAPAGAPVEEPARAEAGAPAQESATPQQDRLRAQARESLAREFVALGDALFARGEHARALEHYSEALLLDPDNEAAKEGATQVRAVLGESDWATAATMIEDAAKRAAVRVAQARLEAESLVERGDQALREGDYDEAIGHYRTAEIILANNPMISSESIDLRLVRQKIDGALARLRTFEEERRVEEEAEAAEALARRERERREARANRLHVLFEEAAAAFRRERFERAESLAQQILLEDPGNQHAIELRENARAARHSNTRDRNARLYREEWLKTFEADLGTLGVPQTQPVIFDDLERWKKVSQRTPLQFSEVYSSEREDEQAVLDTLARVVVPARFGEDGEGAPLEDVADYLQQATGINFFISSNVVDELDEDETSVLLDLPDRSVLSILQIIDETTEGLGWKIEDGVVKFVTTEELVGGQVLRFYEVRDLIRGISDFPGQEINVLPSGGLEPPDEDFEEREALVVTADALDALIRDNVAYDSWEADPANAMRVTEQGTLVVNQTPEVHEQIEALLEDLREATGIMVDIQTRFLTVEDNFIEDIGVDFRGLGSPGLGTNTFFNDFGDASAQATLGNEIGQDTDLGAFYDDGQDGDVRARIENLYDSDLGDEDVLTASGGLSIQYTFLNDLQLEMILRAVSKSERVELVTAPNILVFNTARSNLAVLNQVAYVQDYDVEIAQAASIADPIIGVVQDGVVLDVRPVVSADRRFITLELRPTVATLVRPIAERTTTLANQNAVTIQLPELEIAKVRTSVPMPDGATVLLGGWKVSDSIDQRSGVPFLNKLPILSFFFERKGTFITKRKLLILLKAQIVIPKEHEPTPAQVGVQPQPR